jgi:anti-sigma factor RsiW
MAMDNDACRQLDAYLDGELSGVERLAFDAHLATCPACRESVDQQRWIDQLLRSDEAATIESTPLSRSLPTVRVRRRRLALVAAAAVIAATAAIMFPLPGREGRPTIAQAPAPDASPDSNHVGTGQGSDSRILATDRNLSPGPVLPGRGISVAAFVGDGSSIAIPVASDDPQVTIVQLYPTATALRRWQRESELRGHALPPNGG